MNSMDPQDSRLYSQYYTPAQLMALGRIAELSALLEVLLRQVLGQVMGISEAAGEALFLGDRASNLVARIKELGKFGDMPKWFSDEAIDWAKRVSKAIEVRDDLLHRAPVLLYRDEEDVERVVGWNRARRAHKPLPIDDDRLLKVVELLAELQGEAMGKLFWDEWEASVGDNRRP
jgi:hypothetical protein